MKKDYRKEEKNLYFPKTIPTIIEVPKMSFIAVRGKDNPNEENGEYKKAMQILYGLTFTIKMSKNKGPNIKGYFDYSLPPLEGLWDISLDKITDFGITDKNEFSWISIIRIPEYVTEEVFEWAKEVLLKKHKDIDYSNTMYLTFEEGLYVQMMHIGSYDNEMKSITLMKEYIDKLGYEEDFNKDKYRFHHEIYLSDPRKTSVDKLKTVIRHPIKKK